MATTMLDGRDDEFRLCETIARQHYENFSVLSAFVPGSLRPHLSAIYAFCRGVDDLGDELAGDRRRALTKWRNQLDRTFAGSPEHPVFRALGVTIERFSLPYEEFDKLIRANEMDQEARRYETFADTLNYCVYSANPVGRLVLGLFGCADPKRLALSDAICTGLQLANFLQDLPTDLARGRSYWPEEDYRQFDLSSDELAKKGGDAHQIQSWTRFEAERTLQYFRQGRPLEHAVPWRLGRQLALYRLGGEAVVEAILLQGANPWNGRPTVSHWRKLQLMVQVLTA
ncbi:MAG: squalene synthase HpnC [Sulfobacillus acidophilus]|uniref:Squalene synthase HpnC n=1 Tax=Sulfobacillus acidophilus TaxID=53633 RepID=A0A2T2WH15_9FIRM|nr:MAG: squalene synthase HpnC [Sulfobacillus acidophilus]